jgi:hypothetical protein
VQKRSAAAVARILAMGRRFGLSDSATRSEHVSWTVIATRGIAWFVSAFSHFFTILNLPFK